jgi:hypothetical protein
VLKTYLLGRTEWAADGMKEYLSPAACHLVGLDFSFLLVFPTRWMHSCLSFKHHNDILFGNEFTMSFEALRPPLMIAVTMRIKQLRWSSLGAE